jgi:hypothetical protein
LLCARHHLSQCTRTWSEAISGLPIFWSMKRVAPTAVTHGDEAGQEGQSTTFAFFWTPEKVVEFAVVSSAESKKGADESVRGGQRAAHAWAQ